MIYLSTSLLINPWAEAAEAWELPPPPYFLAWRWNKPAFSSEVDLSAKLMFMITVHEKSIPRGEPEEKKPANGGMGVRRRRMERGINLHVSVCLISVPVV